MNEKTFILTNKYINEWPLLMFTSFNLIRNWTVSVPFTKGLVCVSIYNRWGACFCCLLYFMQEVHCVFLSTCAYLHNIFFIQLFLNLEQNLDHLIQMIFQTISGMESSEWDFTSLTSCHLCWLWLRHTGSHAEYLNSWARRCLVSQFFWDHSFYYFFSYACFGPDRLPISSVFSNKLSDFE